MGGSVSDLVFWVEDANRSHSDCFDPVFAAVIAEGPTTNNIPDIVSYTTPAE